MTTSSIISKDNPLFQKICQLEEGLWIAETRYNQKLMKEIFAPDFFEFGRSGKRYTYEDFFEESEKEDLSSDPKHEINAKFPLPLLEMREVSEDTILVTYISEVTYKGEIERSNRSSLWSFIDGKWRLRFHQGTPIKS